MSLIKVNPPADLRYLDFHALYDAGYRGAVFDKDNCLVRFISSLIVRALMSY